MEKKLTIEALKEVFGNSDFFSIDEFKGETYVRFEEPEVCDINRDLDEWGVKARAVKIGDEIDEDGYAPAYELFWIANRPIEETAYMSQDEFVDFCEVDGVWDSGEINMGDYMDLD